MRLEKKMESPDISPSSYSSFPYYSIGEARFACGCNFLVCPKPCILVRE
jgi:hypothetical protein